MLSNRLLTASDFEKLLWESRGVCKQGGLNRDELGSDRLRLAQTVEPSEPGTLQ